MEGIEDDRLDEDGVRIYGCVGGLAFDDVNDFKCPTYMVSRSWEQERVLHLMTQLKGV